MKNKKLILINIFLFLILFAGVVRSENNFDCKITPKLRKETCDLVIEIINKSDVDSKISFSEGKHYDVFVVDSADKEVWQWSEGKVFIQAIEEIYIAPGESHAFNAKWFYKGNDGNVIQPGKYKIRGLVNIVPEPIYTEWKKIEVLKSYLINKNVIIGKITKILDNYYLLSEDGVAYRILNMSSDIEIFENNKIKISEYEITDIPESVDKNIEIIKYEKM